MNKAKESCEQLDILVRNYINENNLPIDVSREDFPLRKDFFYLDYLHQDYHLVLEPWEDKIGITLNPIWDGAPDFVFEKPEEAFFFFKYFSNNYADFRVKIREENSFDYQKLLEKLQELKIPTIYARVE